MCYVEWFQQAAWRHSLEPDLNLKFVVMSTKGGLLVLLEKGVVSGPIILRESQETIARVAAAPHCLNMRIMRVWMDILIPNRQTHLHEHE